MIEFLFFFCLPTLAGYDCSYQAYMVDDANDYWAGTGTVAAMYDGDHTIYIQRWQEYHHEWRHAFCSNHYTIHAQNHSYCLNPHFKIQR